MLVFRTTFEYISTIKVGIPDILCWMVLGAQEKKKVTFATQNACQNNIWP